METKARSVVKRNVATNVIGGGWSVVLNLLAIPVQIRILGAESYGLIGFVASLQSILVILDFGIPTTVIREVARDTSPGHRAIHPLLQTSSTIYWTVAGAVALTIIAAAGWISQHWLIVETLAPEYVAGGIGIMAFYVLFTWPLNIYVGALSGLQRLDLVNLLRVVSVTAAQVGGILILLVLHDLYALLIWMTLIAILNLIAHAWMTRRLLPHFSFRPGFSRSEVKRVWKFSLDMNLISTLAIVYTQMDRLLIGALLPLRFLGYYNVAYNVTRGLVTIQGFFSSAILPALARDHSEGNKELMRLRYHKFAQVMIYLVALPSFVFMFFGRDILSVWTTSETAANAYAAMTLLTFGTLLNSAASAPFVLSVATGHSRIPLLVNIYGLAIYLPALYFLTLRGGIDGAALAWVLLNLYYLILLIPWIQRRVFKENSIEYYAKNFLPFLSLALVFWIGSRVAAAQTSDGSLQRWPVFAVTGIAAAALGFCFLDRSIRRLVLDVPLALRDAFMARK